MKDFIIENNQKKNICLHYFHEFIFFLLKLYFLVTFELRLLKNDQLAR